MIQQTTRYGMSVTVPIAYDQAVTRTKDALAQEGFGVLTEIDIAATLKKKLDVEFRPYVILGACNPPLAYRALTTERDIGLLLPCNVIVYSAADPRQSVVAAMDPVVALELTGNDAIHTIAADVRARLRRVLEIIEQGAGTTPAAQT